MRYYIIRLEHQEYNRYVQSYDDPFDEEYIAFSCAYMDMIEDCAKFETIKEAIEVCNLCNLHNYTILEINITPVWCEQITRSS